MDSYSVSQYTFATSISTNATAPNLAGPGRGLGQLYDLGGAALERGIGKAARAIGIKPVDYDDQPFHRETFEERNAIAPNLPGPGRSLDLLYTWAGEILEIRLAKAALSLGYGPNAAALRVERRLKGMRWGNVEDFPSDWHVLMGDERLNELRASKELVKECRRLLKYIKYVVSCCLREELARQRVE